MEKKNCWEVKNCGRQPGGLRADELGVCPAATEDRLHGIHGGKNAGRACWVVTGTYCRGDVQGAFTKKFAGCLKCDFYHQVQNEEAPNVELSVELLKRLA